MKIKAVKDFIENLIRSNKYQESDITLSLLYKLRDKGAKELENISDQEINEGRILFLRQEIRSNSEEQYNQLSSYEELDMRLQYLEQKINIEHLQSKFEQIEKFFKKLGPHESDFFEMLSDFKKKKGLT